MSSRHILEKNNLLSPPRGTPFFSTVLCVVFCFAGTTTVTSLNNSFYGMVNLSVSTLGSSTGCVFLHLVLSSYSTDIPIISRQNFLNSSPCTGFVCISAHMLFVPMSRINRSPWATLFVTRKYLFLMCLHFYQPIASRSLQKGWSIFLNLGTRDCSWLCTPTLP